MDIETVRKVATLARLKVTEEDLNRYGPQISNIIKFVEQLDEVDTGDLAPLANVVDIKLPLRADAVTDGNIQKDVLKNAPEQMEGFFVVPKIVE